MGVEGSSWTVDDMRRRLVRYADLRPCYNAFIDTRTPGSEAKENFTIIGPGVSENPDQFVHIAEPHGYNIGGARQPPGCVNSQHSHTTAEVFVAHKGQWRFDLGETGEDAQVFLDEGDVISIPTNLFRGFTNVGDTVGYLWAVLGKDDPGRVTWAPKVFEMARHYGLVLLESGKLIDTKQGHSVQPGDIEMKPTSPDDVAAMTIVSPDDAEAFVWRNAGGEAGSSAGRASPIVGENGRFAWPHGFVLEQMALSGDDVRPESYDGSKVMFVHHGSVTFRWNEGSLLMEEGDTLSIPRGLTHHVSSDDAAELYVVRQDDDNG